MTTPFTRELSIVYSSSTPITFSSAPFFLDSQPPLSLEEGPDDAVLTFTVLVTGVGATDALRKVDYATNLETMRTALREPRARLRILLSGSTWRDFNSGTGVNTGFHQTPSMEKIGDVTVDSAVAARWRVTFRIELPADGYSQEGRRTSNVELNYTGSRRRSLTITGEYRALTGEDSARAQYEANIATYAGSLLGAGSLSGSTWDLTEEEVDHGDIDKICSFVRVYREIIHNQASGTLDHISIIDPELTIRVVTSSPGDSPGPAVKRVKRLMVSYKSSVPWMGTGATTDLKGLYSGTIKPFIIGEAKAAFAAGFVALEEESGPVLIPYENVIECTMTLIASAGGGVIEYRKSTEIQTRHGITLVPVWNGDPLARYAYQGPATIIRTTTETTKRIGGSSKKFKTPAKVGDSGGAIGLAGFGDFGAGFSGGGGDSGTLGSTAAFGGDSKPAKTASGAGAASGSKKVSVGTSSGSGGVWILQETRTRVTPLVVGDPPYTYTVQEEELTTVEEKAVIIGDPTRPKKKTTGTSAAF